MQTNIIELISNSCGCSQTEAQEYLDSEIRYLRELQEADDLRGDDIGMACSNLGLHPKFLRHSINRYNMVYSDTTSIDQCNILEEPSFLLHTEEEL